MNLKSLKAQLIKQTADLAQQAALIAKKLAAINLLLDENEQTFNGEIKTDETGTFTFQDGLLIAPTKADKVSTKDRTWNVIKSLGAEAFSVLDVIKNFGKHSLTDGAIYFAVRSLAKEGKLRPVAFNEKGNITRYMIANGTDDEKSVKSEPTLKLKRRRKSKRQPSTLYALKSLAEMSDHAPNALEIQRHIKRVQKQRLTINATRQALLRLIDEGHAKSQKIGKKFVRFSITKSGIEAAQQTVDETEKTPANATRNIRDMALDVLHSRAGEWSAAEVAINLRDKQKVEVHPETIRQALNKLAVDGHVLITRNAFHNVRYSLTDSGRDEWQKQFQPSRIVAAAATQASIQ